MGLSFTIAAVPSQRSRMTVFYCLRFETRPTRRSMSPYLYPPGTEWPSYTPRHWISVYLICLSNLFICDCTALVDLGRFFSFLIFTQSVGLLERGISPSQGHYLHAEQHKNRINARRHSCLEWGSNPRSQCSSRRRRFMP
jgi:hypothetical protein